MAVSPARWDPVRAVGAVLALGCIVLAMVAGAPLGAFIDVAGFLAVVLGGPVAWRALVGGDRAVLGRVLRDPNPTAAALDRAELVARARRRAYWSMALLGSLIGAIQLLNALDDPSAIGPALAVVALSLLYTVLADLFVASPAIARVRARRAEASAAPPQLDVTADPAAARLFRARSASERQAARPGTP